MLRAFCIVWYKFLNENQRVRESHKKIIVIIADCWKIGKLIIGGLQVI